MSAINLSLLEISLLDVAASEKAVALKLKIGKTSNVAMGKQYNAFETPLPYNTSIVNISNVDKLSGVMREANTFSKTYLPDVGINRMDHIVQNGKMQDITQLGDVIFSLSEPTTDKASYLINPGLSNTPYYSEPIDMVYYTLGDNVDPNMSELEMLGRLDDNFAYYNGSELTNLEVKTPYAPLPGLKDNAFNLLYEFGTGYQYENEDSLLEVDQFSLKNNLNPFESQPVRPISDDSITGVQKNQFELWRNYKNTYTVIDNIAAVYNLETPFKETVTITNTCKPINYGSAINELLTGENQAFVKNITMIGGIDNESRVGDLNTYGFSLYMGLDKTGIRKMAYSYKRKIECLSNEDSDYNYMTTGQLYGAIVKGSKTTSHNKVVQNAYDPNTYPEQDGTYPVIGIGIEKIDGVDSLIINAAKYNNLQQVDNADVYYRLGFKEAALEFDFGTYIPNDNITVDQYYKTANTEFKYKYGSNYMGTLFNNVQSVYSRSASMESSSLDYSEIYNDFSDIAIDKLDTRTVDAIIKQIAEAPGSYISKRYNYGCIAGTRYCSDGHYRNTGVNIDNVSIEMANTDGDSKHALNVFGTKTFTNETNGNGYAGSMPISYMGSATTEESRTGILRVSTVYSQEDIDILKFAFNPNNPDNNEINSPYFWNNGVPLISEAEYEEIFSNLNNNRISENNHVAFALLQLPHSNVKPEATAPLNVRIRWVLDGISTNFGDTPITIDPTFNSLDDYNLGYLTQVKSQTLTPLKFTRLYNYNLNGLYPTSKTYSADNNVMKIPNTMNNIYENVIFAFEYYTCTQYLFPVEDEIVIKGINIAPYPIADCNNPTSLVNKTVITNNGKVLNNLLQEPLDLKKPLPATLLGQYIPADTTTPEQYVDYYDAPNTIIDDTLLVGYDTTANYIYNENTIPNNRQSYMNFIGSVIGGVENSNTEITETIIYTAINSFIDTDKVIDFATTVSFKDQYDNDYLQIKTYINGHLIKSNTYNSSSQEYATLHSITRPSDIRLVSAGIFAHNVSGSTNRPGYTDYYSLNNGGPFFRLTLFNIALDRANMINVSELDTDFYQQIDGYRFGAIIVNEKRKIIRSSKYQLDGVSDYYKRLEKIKDFDFIEYIDSIHKLMQVGGRKSNLYSVEVKDTGLTLQNGDTAETVAYKKEAQKLLKQAVTTICERVEPINTKLLSILIS